MVIRDDFITDSEIDNGLIHSAEHLPLLAVVARIDWAMNPLFSDAQANVESKKPNRLWLGLECFIGDSTTSPLFVFDVRA